MPKYFMLWEVDPSAMPADPKERGALWLGMTEMVKQDIKEGRTSDWGCFVGETNGYAVGEQSEIDLAKDLQRFYPAITFRVFQVMSVDQIAEVAKSLTA